jgi:hypothetical protein
MKQGIFRWEIPEQKMEVYSWENPPKKSEIFHPPNEHRPFHQSGLEDEFPRLGRTWFRVFDNLLEGKKRNPQ